MTWSWDDTDVRRFRQLQRTAATVLRQAHERGGQPFKGAVADMTFAHKAACRARFPTLDQSEVAILRQWLAHVSGYCSNGQDYRLANHAAFARSHALATTILKIGDDPPPLPPAAASGQRLPYKDD